MSHEGIVLTFSATKLVDTLLNLREELIIHSTLTLQVNSLAFTFRIFITLFYAEMASVALKYSDDRDFFDSELILSYGEKGEAV